MNAGFKLFLCAAMVPAWMAFLIELACAIGTHN
jgi:hypothetical protein